MKKATGGLTPQEVAAITGCVPCTGKQDLDAIISLSLKVRIATQVMASMASTLPPISPGDTIHWDAMAQDALDAAKALIARLQGEGG